MAGALVLGTVILSFALVATRPGTSGVALAAMQSFAIASLVAGAVPTLRDRLLGALRWSGHLATAVVVLLAVASRPAVDPSTVILAAGTVAITFGVAAVAAVALRRDVLSALAAAGTRDPVVAVGLAWSMGGPDATAVPLVNAVILGTAAAALIIRRR